jgi:lactoylglutathione lyase
MLPHNTIDGITLHIRHTMLPVSNMDRTVDFYTRLLGMDIQRIRDVPERNERVRYLGYGSEDEGPSLELIESVESRGKAPLAQWTGHIALYVSDCYKLCEKSQSGGRGICQRPGTEPARRQGYLRLYQRSGRLCCRANRTPRENRSRGEPVQRVTVQPLCYSIVQRSRCSSVQPFNRSRSDGPKPLSLNSAKRD